MIIIVETNFILELALQQGEVEQAEAIVKLAEEDKIELVIPAFSFMEADFNVAAQCKRRNDLQNRLTSEIKQIARSRTNAELTLSLMSVADALESFGDKHCAKLAHVIHRLSAIATVIPVTDEVIEQIPSLRDEKDLATGDACVCASVACYARDLNGEESLFVTKDRDFDEPARCCLLTNVG